MVVVTFYDSSDINIKHSSIELMLPLAFPDLRCHRHHCRLEESLQSQCHTHNVTTLNVPPSLLSALDDLFSVLLRYNSMS